MASPLGTSSGGGKRTGAVPLGGGKRTGAVSAETPSAKKRDTGIPGMEMAEPGMLDAKTRGGKVAETREDVV